MWMLFKKMARNEAREKMMKNIFFYNHLKSSLTPSLPPSSSHFSLFFFGSLLMVCFHSNTSARQQQPTARVNSGHRQNCCWRWEREVKNVFLFSIVIDDVKMNWRRAEWGEKKTSRAGQTIRQNRFSFQTKISTNFSPHRRRVTVHNGAIRSNKSMIDQRIFPWFELRSSCDRLRRRLFGGVAIGRAANLAPVFDSDRERGMLFR